MSNDANKLGEVWIKVMPDFKVIKPYLFPEMSQVEFNKEAKLYKAAGKVSIPFLTIDEGQSYCDNLEKVIQKYKLQEHVNNMFFIISYTYSNVVQRINNIERPGRESTERVREFDESVSLLAANINCPFTITFEEKVGNIESDHLLKPIKSRRKPIRFKFTHDETTKWITTLIVDAIKNGKVPMSIGTQLMNSSIISDGSALKFLLSAPTASLIKGKDKESVNGAIVSLAIPIINYLENETHIKKANGKNWSYEQLGVILDVLYITGLQSTKSTLNYKFHFHKPTTSEKDKLDKLLQRSVKNHKLLIIRPTK